MQAELPKHTQLTIIGRSSSHFTRVARIYAAEARLDYTFQLARDLMALDQTAYGDNPALKLPILQTPRGVWFGALNISRELCRQSSSRPKAVWPEDFDQPLLANAQELVLQAMTTEVMLIMTRLAGTDEASAHQVKMRQSLTNTMAWLERNAEKVLAELPSNRDLSYLEVTLYCLVQHLPFRGVLTVDAYAKLNEFCQRFASRDSVRETAYRLDE
jgi:glutathione S-transferase